MGEARSLASDCEQHGGGLEGLVPSMVVELRCRATVLEVTAHAKSDRVLASALKR